MSQRLAVGDLLICAAFQSNASLSPSPLSSLFSLLSSLAQRPRKLAEPRFRPSQREGKAGLIKRADDG